MGGRRAQPVRPHYFICNADESEPGTFKDRVLMEQRPVRPRRGDDDRRLRHRLRARATSTSAASTRWRRRAATHAIDEARAHGFLGDDMMGEGFRFDIELRRGAGAYICGEETALFNSIEGYRGEPRNKPPFPVEVGLFGKPTVINNVETLVNVLAIVLDGGAAYAEIGTEGSTGPKLFCVSGSVARPGLYEVDFGVTLRRCSSWRAASPTGAAAGDPARRRRGRFVTPDELDIAAHVRGHARGGHTLGSGVVMVFDDTVDLAQIVLRIAAFFRDESCGQCVPCRVGTVRQEEALRASRRQARSARSRRARAAHDIGQAMTRRVDLRAGTDGGGRGPVGDSSARRLRDRGHR